MKVTETPALSKEESKGEPKVSDQDPEGGGTLTKD
jgi:hypothetical protein